MWHCRIIVDIYPI